MPTTAAATEFKFEGVIRFHAKSKSGCLTCRKRRIKCDETKPICKNCNRRNIECVQRSGDEDNQEQQQQQRIALYKRPITPTPISMDITSHRIVHHFATSTAASFCSDRQYANTTSISVPHLSWKDPVVLHAMLSCTALHLGRLYPGPNSNNDINWIGLASAHRKAAMAVLPKATTVDAKSLTIALFTMYTISSSLASSPENIFSLMTSLHNVWSALEGHRMYTDEKLNTISLFFDHSHADSGVKTIWHLRRIYDSPTSGIELESEELADSKIRGAYKQAVEALYAAYPFSLTGYESKSAVLWPTQFGKEFCVLLQEKRQRALVVLYYYLEMLKGMNKECWWASDAARCQDYVYGLLDVEWRGWLLDVTEDLTSNTTRLTY